MPQLFTTDTHPTVTKALGRSAKIHFALFDSPREIGEWSRKNVTNWSIGNSRSADLWSGNETSDSAMRKCLTGDRARAEPSNALLAKFEQFAFATQRKTWTDDLAGSIPNVPAFVAGHPLGMRRRIKRESAAAPVAIIADLTTSAAISAESINRRGAAILALVRILSGRRPVELWAGVALDANGANACAIFTRIDTTPLDLATAAYVLTSAAFPRKLCYSLAGTKYGFRGHWPFYNQDLTRQHGAAFIAPGFPHVLETLFIPPAHTDDEIETNPEAWIEKKLNELAPVNLDD